MTDQVFFWVTAGGLSLAVGALLALAVLRVRDTGPEAASDVEVYRDQLKEVDRDLARGVISEEDAQRVQVEVSRRLLEADKAAQTGDGLRDAPAALNGFGAAVVGLGTVAGAVALYFWIGAPGAPDVPLKLRLAEADAQKAARPPQAEMQITAPGPIIDADPDFLALMEKLRAAVQERPGDIQGLVLLAQNEARLGNYVAAHEAQAEIIKLRGAAAEARDFAAYADLLVLAANGYVSPEAEAAADTALSKDPSNGTSRYYKGLAYGQSGRFDLAYQTWQDLLADSHPRDPWVQLILGQMEGLAGAAGVKWRPPEALMRGPTLPGPSSDDMAAAADMDAEDRQAMIRGMVDGLAERLATEGGSPDEWARLINALGVLGDTDRARAIWQEAQSVFAPYPDAVDTIRLAAESAGVAE